MKSEEVKSADMRQKKMRTKNYGNTPVPYFYVIPVQVVPRQRMKTEVYWYLVYQLLVCK